MYYSYIKRYTFFFISVLKPLLDFLFLKDNQVKFFEKTLIYCNRHLVQKYRFYADNIAIICKSTLNLKSLFVLYQPII